MKRKIRVFKHNQFKSEEIEVPDETAVTIYLNGNKIASIAASPENLKELVLGFLFTESFIDSIDDIESLEFDSSNNFSIRIKKDIPFETTRARIITSGCASGEVVLANFKGISRKKNFGKISARNISEFIERSMSEISKNKGRGIHHAVAGLPDGLLVTFSDIGRHNALDKLAGHLLLKNKLPPDLVFATGRLSSEMVLKCLRMGARAAVSLSTPTSTAVRLAENYGIILIGYARTGSFKVYTGTSKLY